MMYYSPSRNAFINDGTIWADVVAVPEEDYQRILSELQAGRILTSDESGNPITIEPPIAEPVIVPLKTVFDLRVQKLNEDYDFAVDYIKSGYPLAETITWPVQVVDARMVKSWLAEDQSRVVADFPRELAPFLYDLAMSRIAKGLESDLLDLTNRVLHNDSQFSPAMALFTAERHAAEKRLVAAYTANDRAALEAVTWSFYLVPPPDMSMDSATTA
jgi:hypothetical protein